MEWYVKVFQNYANFEGRARRKEYWMFTLINGIIGLILQMLMIFNSDNMSFLMLTMIYGLAVIVPCTAVLARRLHDVGKSGWFQLISLVPLIGGIWLLILTVTEGDAGTNAYGMNPKELEYASQEM